MKPSGLLLLVAASLTLSAPASTRPHYGGTLRLALRETPASLDPADASQAAMPAWPSLSRLIFDTLSTLDARGQLQPSLSSSWQAEPGNQRWRFVLRRGITFQDGTLVDPAAVAAALRTANSKWKVFANADAVMIECEVPTPDLPAILALPRYGIAKRSGGKLTGSGPFAVGQWGPGKKLVLSARDDYWGGRAFADSVEIELGRTFHEQTIALDLGKSDVVEIAADQARHAVLEGRRVESSAPSEWMVLVFARDNQIRDSQSAQDAKLRQALSLSIDRESMNNVLLQGGGEPAGSFLPNWLTGYAFLFPKTVDLPRARQLRSEVNAAPTWSLSYDASDALARVIAERIALNARDAGIAIQLTNSGAGDIRLVRMPLPSLDARVALNQLAAGVGLASPMFDGDPLNGLYGAENALLQSQRVIPLLHLRIPVALSGRVKGWQQDPDGSWHLPNVWLETEKP